MRKRVRHCVAIGTEMALHVLAYNMKQVISILGVGGLMLRNNAAAHSVFTFVHFCGTFALPRYSSRVVNIT